jgi:ABC-type multidrug transport system fused ATPase/permease subunit
VTAALKLVIDTTSILFLVKQMALDNVSGKFCSELTALRGPLGAVKSIVMNTLARYK